MLFHVVATHQAHTCPVAISMREDGEAFYRDTIGKVVDMSFAAEANVQLHSALVSGPKHTIFLTIEADEQGGLTKFLSPLKLIGDCDVTLVTDLTAIRQ